MLIRLSRETCICGAIHIYLIVDIYICTCICAYVQVYMHIHTYIHDYKFLRSPMIRSLTDKDPKEAGSAVQRPESWRADDIDLSQSESLRPRSATEKRR
jgi:hypothetical protein